MIIVPEATNMPVTLVKMLTAGRAGKGSSIATTAR